jgi:hypothetical protein
MFLIVEAPIMLAGSWFVYRWCVDRLDVNRTVPARSLMGLVAFLVLMSAEVGLGAFNGGTACRLRIARRSDRSRRSGDLCYLPGIQVWRFGKPLDRQNTAAL